ncbi:Pre-mRNA-splicing factor slt11 [Malassezia sp. CBS 17886]|nr:Pre-mRNA-splicing factor slt11 [Malassezia sp. CBS 17886]
MSAYGFLNKQDTGSAGSSSADTPILCETCLGPNPYVRMSKQEAGAECKVCGRPFTVFRWKAGAGMRFKRTEICTTCAKLKNVCQTCILDLRYQLPTHVRDAALGIQSKIPTSEVNRQYFANRMDALMAESEDAPVESSIGAARGGHEILQKLAHAEPDYKRNRPHVCSFYARGECNRGDACPYRHEDAPPGKQRLQDRYHGTDDQAARQILRKAANARGLVPPIDKGVMTLFLTGLPADATDASLRSYFLASVPRLGSGDIRAITLVPRSHAAFVNFTSRDKAEQAAECLAVKVDLGGNEVRVAWGRSASKPTAPSVAEPAQTCGAPGG